MDPSAVNTEKGVSEITEEFAMFLFCRPTGFIYLSLQSNYYMDIAIKN